MELQSGVHSRLMSELGCTYLQGYYIGQPEERGAAPLKEVCAPDMGERAA